MYIIMQQALTRIIMMTKGVTVFDEAILGFPVLRGPEKRCELYFKAISIMGVENHIF